MRPEDLLAGEMSRTISGKPAARGAVTTIAKAIRAKAAVAVAAAVAAVVTLAVLGERGVLGGTVRALSGYFSKTSLVSSE